MQVSFSMAIEKVEFMQESFLKYFRMGTAKIKDK